ncbi:MAG: hypothetical protein JWO38_4747 [Gemmataceae bacterium]|nr:hypothetical protein [Gemmataceae bacterium]
MPVPPFLFVLGFLAAWVGHACVWTSALNHVYARPYPKAVLKVWRFTTGVVILAFPWLVVTIFNPRDLASAEYDASSDPFNGLWGRVVRGYALVCLVFGAVVFPAVTIYRLRRRPPAALVAEKTETLDLWAELGKEAVGNGRGVAVTRLPLNCVFRVDFTELTLALPGLPPEWDGLSVLHLSDVHFHGTPSLVFFERVLAEIETRWPTPDLVCLAGDYVDTDEHAAWIGPLLGRLTAREAKFAVLGNHDRHHDPDHVRAELGRAGYTVLSNRFDDPVTAPRVVVVRGVPCTVVGHEGPWFPPAPQLPGTAETAFRLCLSHTPDNFYWGQKNRIGLMLCGHVHGGQIRVPVIGSIFVPSVYGRRFDMGVFEGGGTVMVVGRGLSGKEPLRFRCHPQVIRITLKKGRVE